MILLNLNSLDKPRSGGSLTTQILVIYRLGLWLFNFIVIV